MTTDAIGFTAREFTDRCKANAQPVSRWGFNDHTSRQFLNRCCEVGLLTLEGGLYVPTYRLHVALSQFDPRR